MRELRTRQGTERRGENEREGEKEQREREGEEA